MIVTSSPTRPSDQSPDAAIELTIVMPCLNEARTVGTCIEKAQTFLREHGVAGEVIVADNGSTDGSQAIAERLGARVVPVSERGYGKALRAGIAAARGRFVVMGDSDDSYDFLRLSPFLDKLREGYDVVLGNRFAGGIAPGAMPPLHRFFGNPLLTLIGRTLYRSPSHDFYCGLRGFRRDAVLGLGLDAPGMEFALEMIVKAAIAKLRMTEVPTTLSPDGRGRPPHLRSWRDGWRSLRFFLLLSPRGLFLYPGVAILAFGLVSFVGLIGGDVHVERASPSPRSTPSSLAVRRSSSVSRRYRSGPSPRWRRSIAACYRPIRASSGCARGNRRDRRGRRRLADRAGHRRQRVRPGLLGLAVVRPGRARHVDPRRDIRQHGPGAGLPNPLLVVLHVPAQLCWQKIVAAASAGRGLK